MVSRYYSKIQRIKKVNSINMILYCAQMWHSCFSISLTHKQSYNFLISETDSKATEWVELNMKIFTNLVWSSSIWNNCWLICERENSLWFLQELSVKSSFERMQYIHIKESNDLANNSRLYKSSKCRIPWLQNVFQERSFKLQKVELLTRQLKSKRPKSMNSLQSLTLMY